MVTLPGGVGGGDDDCNTEQHWRVYETQWHTMKVLWLESASRRRTTKHVTRQFNTQSLKSLHCHRHDFDDKEILAKWNRSKKRSWGHMAASQTHLLTCVSGLVIVTSDSGSSTDYCLCANDASEVWLKLVATHFGSSPCNTRTPENNLITQASKEHGLSQVFIKVEN